MAALVQDKSPQSVVYIYHTIEPVAGTEIYFNDCRVSSYLRPIHLALQWAFWVIFLSGAAQVMSQP